MESFAQNSTLDPQLVSAKAYEIWESLGRPEGVAERTWLEAERLLRQPHEQPSVKAAPAESSVTETAAANVELVEPEPPVAPVATASATKMKSEPPSSPSSNVQQKKPTGGTKRGSRR